MILPYFHRLSASQIIPQKCGFDRENRDGHGCDHGDKAKG